MSAGERLEEKRPAGVAVADEELVRRTRAGQRSAFDELVERYQRRATSIAYRLLGNLHDALEVCQDAFIRAYRNLDTLDDVQRFAPWFLRIVTNLSLNYRRGRSLRRRSVSFEDCLIGDDQSSDELVSDSATSDTRPSARLSADELSERVQAALAELTDQQRLALVLFSIEQMPQKDVATIMKCSVEAVKWHVFQARKKMKDLLQEWL